MADGSGGPGWWQGSDGRWYPPEGSPAHRRARPPPPYRALPPPGAAAPGTAVPGAAVPEPAEPGAAARAAPAPADGTPVVEAIPGVPTGHPFGRPRPAGSGDPGTGSSTDAGALDRSAAAAAAAVPGTRGPEAPGGGWGDPEAPSRTPRLPGWSGPAGGLRSAGEVLAPVEGGRALAGPGADAHAATNLLWSAGTALAALAVLVLSLHVWYVAHAVVTGGPVSVSLRAPARLLGPAYGGWRVAVPVLAGAEILLAMVAAAIWGTRRQSRPYLAVQRVVAFAAVGVIVASLTLRVPSMAGLTGSSLDRGTLAGLEVSFHLTVGAWLALVASVVAFACTLPIAVKFH